jgi:hypothetical protein
MQRVLEQQQMNMPTITLKDSEGTEYAHAQKWGPGAECFYLS